MTLKELCKVLPLGSVIEVKRMEGYLFTTTFHTSSEEIMLEPCEWEEDYVSLSEYDMCKDREIEKLVPHIVLNGTCIFYQVFLKAIPNFPTTLFRRKTDIELAIEEVEKLRRKSDEIPIKCCECSEFKEENENGNR